MDADALHQRHRLEEIARLDLFRPEVDALLHDFAERASATAAQPAALVTIVLTDAQYFAAMFGLSSNQWQVQTRSTPIELSFCRYVVEDRAPFVVPDTLLHPRTKDVLPVVKDDGVRCYLGVPLELPSGAIIGSICVMGNATTDFSTAQIDQLKTLAGEVVSKLEARVARR